MNYSAPRPGWFTRDRETKYRITRKGEPFAGRDASLDGLSDLIVKLSLDPWLHARESIGGGRG